MSNNVKTSPMELGSMPIGKLLVQYSVPAIIASLATSLYNIIDSIFIGRGVGAMAIAGLAITFPLMNLVAAFVMLVAVGGATISSIFLGQGNIRRATDTVNNVFLLCMVHAVIFGGGSLLFLDEILIFFGATAETLPYAHEFMEVILYGTPVSFILIGLNNVMRATGYPTKAMITALISVVVNIVLCPIFIFTFDWGIKGAALATICGQSVGALWVLAHFLSPKSFVRLRIRDSWFNKAIINRIYAIGLSPFLMNVCACVVVVFINKALLDYGGTLGNMAIGAFGILNRATMFFVMIVFGVTQGMQPILGFNYGACQWQRVRNTLNTGIWIGLAITTVGWIITEFFPRQHQPPLHCRSDTHRHGQPWRENIFHSLSPRRLSDNHPELFPVCRQTENIHLSLADASAHIPSAVPVHSATPLGHRRCLGKYVGIRRNGFCHCDNYSYNNEPASETSTRTTDLAG